MSFYSHALLQELSCDWAKVVDYLPLYVRRPVPLTPAAQSAYVTSLASQLLVAIHTFVNLHLQYPYQLHPSRHSHQFIVGRLVESWNYHPGTSLPHYRTAHVFLSTGYYFDAFSKLQPI
jgi:hypothetical protein